MKKPATALISWVPAAKGGRKRPPSEPYVTVARFAKDVGWPKVLWNVTVKRLQAYRQGRFWFAQIGFLSDKAPAHLLRKGARFELYEGSQLVATGIVQGVKESPPQGVQQLRSVLLT